MLPFGVTILATVPQRLEIPEGLVNYPVYIVRNCEGVPKEFLLCQILWIYGQLVHATTN
jgi:hypothetical protein